MSTSKSSRTLPSDPSLAEVLAAIQSDLGCSARQRQDRCSAIRTFAKACPECGTDFEIVTTNPLELNRVEEEGELVEEDEEVEDGDN